MRELPDGLYPFIDERLPLSEFVMVEAPSDLEALFKSQAACACHHRSRHGHSSCVASPSNIPDATFLFIWPRGPQRIHMLVPKRFAIGWA